MQVSKLEKGFYQFGNKGNVWANSTHIAKSGDYVTLCETPMLSTNWARIEQVENIGCPDCLKKYKEATAEAVK